MTDKNTDDKPTFFVSRRGRKVGMHEVDLGGIDVDHDTTSEVPVTPVKRSKPEKVPRVRETPKVPRERGRWTKKKTIILAAVVALLLAPILFLELVTAEYGRGVARAKSDLSELVSSTVLPAQKKTTVSADLIRSIAGKVNDTVGHMCRGGLLDNAAGLYPRAKSALVDCKAAQSHYSSLATNLYALETQARYLERVDALIKPVATPITDEFAVIGAQQSAWQNAADGVNKLSPPSAMKSAHDELTNHLSAAAAARSKLNTANNAQDAAAFQEAEKELATEYQAIRETSLLFSAVLGDAQAKINASYSNLK